MPELETLQRHIPTPLLLIETTHQQIYLPVTQSIRVLVLSLADWTLALVNLF